jgi:glycosyltransferase involved in cell wall biosynthesis
MKIFISIASYCDELLFFTLNDCILKANKPENIFFGIVDQNDITQKEKIEKLKFKQQIRYVYINNIDTQGVCWARNIAFSLWNGEEYLLQIDSHMLFENDWDITLINQYNNLKNISQKPIITTYPYNFSFDENNNPVFKKQSDKYALVLRPHPDTSLEEENAVLRFRAEHKLTDEPVSGCHVAGGFIFTSSNFIEEVPYDPFLYFHGEEQSIAIRAYTRGWNIYHPTKIPMYHHYKTINTEYSSQHWNKSIESKRVLSASYLKIRAIKRINRLFYGDGMKGSIYGLGDTRTLDEYIKFSGIDYKNKIIS